MDDEFDDDFDDRLAEAEAGGEGFGDDGFGDYEAAADYMDEGMNYSILTYESGIVSPQLAMNSHLTLYVMGLQAMVRTGQHTSKTADTRK